MNSEAALAVCGGFGAGVWCSVAALRKAAALRVARHWPSVRGRILESVVFRDDARNATHFRVRYEFLLGTMIEGSTPRLSGDWFWSNRQQAAFVARYAPGQEVDVFYDPRNPARNCLDRDDASGITALWVIAVGGTVLAALIVWLELVQ
jgi:Protein of unknown function (DUF3592)